MPIVKSIGHTPTERLLAKLCGRSFLRLWSYPNPVKDDGKELCDLLAVFEDHVFIFFDRESRQLDSLSSEPALRWERWKRTVIEDQVRTAHGAERYVRSRRRIFLDTKLTTEFPIEIDREKMVVHKIIVAHGAAEACKASSERNVSGSLAITYGKLGEDLSWPFLVELDRDQPVHILDSENLEIILGELDTIFDLSSYFDAKIEAIRRYDCFAYCGEEGLLAHYLLNYNAKKNRHFIGTRVRDVNFLMIGEGEWNAFTQTAIYKRKKAADRPSYLWDEMLQKTTENALNGTLLGTSSFLRGRSAMHEMAKEPRFSRRTLATAMIHAIENFPDNSAPLVRNLSLIPSFYKGKVYVFLQLKNANITDYDDHRKKRQAMLAIACGAAKNKDPELETVIGIGIDAPKFSQEEAEDFILMNCKNWTDDDRRHYELANEGFNFFNTRNLVSRRVRSQEFPRKTEQKRPTNRTIDIGRNDPCPCGSGRKYKKCCLYQMQ